MRLPPWIKSDLRLSSLRNTKGLLREFGVSTVCEEARCPNRPECFNEPTAAFMVMGAACSRGCGFCSVTPGIPGPLDPTEPGRVAAAARAMGLRHVVITSVTRDDLPDGGAGHIAQTLIELRRLLPEAVLEALVPDFNGSQEALARVLAAGPDVLNHNVETVPSLYPSVRPGAQYGRSLELLRRAKKLMPEVSTKSGLMVGLGESRQEVLNVMGDLRDANCDILTVGQYLRPTRRNLPVIEYIVPEEFDSLGQEAREMGFRHVASGPMVRSSMKAREHYIKSKPGGVTKHVPVQQN